jgi:hypothetical protein
LQSTTQSKASAWIWPVLSLILAVLLLYISYQNLQLKKQVDSIQERIASAGRLALPSSGAAAAPFDVYLPDGQVFAFHTDSLVAPVILAWLSPDCEPCLEALDGWNTLVDKFPGQLWGISREPRHEFATSAFAEHDVRFPVVTPVSDSVFSIYQVYATPLTLVIAQNGVISQVRPGPLSPPAVDSIISFMGKPYAERR